VTWGPHGDGAVAEESLDDLYEEAPCGYVSLRPDGTILRANRTLLEWIGRDAATLVGRRRFQDLLSVPGKLYYETHFAPLLQMQGHVREIAFDLVRADGGRLPALVNAVQKRGADGVPALVRLTVFDATDRRTYERELLAARRAADQAAAELRQLNETLEQRVEEAVKERARVETALRQAQKLEAVGQLTGGVAHDFNNLLQIIRGNLQLIGREAPLPAEDDRRVRTALGAVERGARLASQLLAFARRQPLEPRPIHPGHLVAGLDEMLRRTLGEEIDLVTVVAEDLWNSFADPGQLENALLNLAVNARDAMPGGGRLTIEAGNAILDETYAARHPEVRPGPYVMVAVTDTGTGMPPDLVERVFEPFFTTKPEGRGTGLGLSQVYGFAKQSEGHVKIYSEVGHGTTVKLYLPRALQAAEAMPAADAGAVRGGTESILVVEDDPQVRSTAAELLQDLGYRVLQAPDAAAALALLEAGEEVDLLFTDVVMPGALRSPELAQRARILRPRVGVLFTSGYTENAIVHGGRLDPGVELLGKPYTREQLARRVRQILDRPVAAGPAAPPLPAEAGGAAADGPLRILLVEDEMLIRMSTEDMLEGLGHRISGVATAEEALRLIDGGEFDLLITDLSLPGMSGLELIRQARRLRPTLGIVVASGHGAAATAELADGVTAWLLPKPYGLPELRRVLGDLRR